MEIHWKRKCKTKQKTADQGLMIRSLVPEDPMGETDFSTFVLFQYKNNNK